MAGLMAALRLREAGHAVTVFESAPVAGGMVRTIREGDWIVEAGATTFADPTPDVQRLLDTHRLLDGAIQPAAVARRRYLVHEGRTVVVPSSPAEMLASPLLSLAGRMRLLKEPFVPRGQATDHESVAGFARRRFGDEVASRFFDPLVTGTTGADPEQVLVRYTFPALAAHERRSGSVLKGRLRAARDAQRNGATPVAGPRSFPDGLDRLPQRIATLLGASLRSGVRITDVTPLDGGVELVDASGATHRCIGVVLAVPAPALGALRLGVEASSLLTAVASMPHASPVVVALGYRRGDVAHPLDGHGVLAPSSERRQALSVQFTSTQFPGRSPDGRVLISVTLGGARQPAHVTMSDAALTTMAHQEVGELLGATAAPVFAAVHRWPAGLPLAVAGHADRLAAADRAELAMPRCVYAGAWRDGASLCEVMEGGIAAANRLLGGGIAPTS